MGVVVHLDDDYVGRGLACDARKLIRRSTNRGVYNDSLLQAGYNGFAATI
jgi:hypothetical protein